MRSHQRKTEYINFLDSLPGNIAVVRSDSLSRPIIEVIYVRNIQRVQSAYFLEQLLKSEHEIELHADASCYYLKDNNAITKTKEDTIIFNLARTEVLSVTTETIISLLVDDNKLIRRAAKDWYEESSISSNI